MKYVFDFIRKTGRERATTGRPCKVRMKSVHKIDGESGRKIGVKSVHRDNVKITHKCACFNGLFAMCVVGATSGRPLCICRADKIKAFRLPCVKGAD